jgi:YHS domain-containing protein
MLLLTLILIRSPLAHAQPANGFCPVLKDRAALSEYSVRYQGRQFYFCCEKCLQAFSLEPEKYLPTPRQARATDASVSAGPVTGGDSHASEAFDGTANRFDSQDLSLISLSVLALVLWFFRHRSNRAKQKPSPTPRSLSSGFRISTYNTVLLALLIGTGCSYYKLRAEVYLNSLKDLIHFRTFEDFGDPPVPAKPPVPPRISAQFYRGNDERSPLLYNGGNYRTATFAISLVGKEGAELDYKSDCRNQDPRVRFHISRAPYTADFFFEERLMREIFLTQQSDPFLGYRTPLKAPVDLSVVVNMHEWEACYPIGKISSPEPSIKSGIIYVAQKRYMDDMLGRSRRRMIGARFHYAIQYRLCFRNGQITRESDIWMGALYRTRNFPAWRLPLSEWFSHEPIPVLPGKDTDDPKLLGTDEYLKQ